MQLLSFVSPLNSSFKTNNKVNHDTILKASIWVYGLLLFKLHLTSVAYGTCHIIVGVFVACVMLLNSAKHAIHRSNTYWGLWVSFWRKLWARLLPPEDKEERARPVDPSCWPWLWSCYVTDARSSSKVYIYSVVHSLPAPNKVSQTVGQPIVQSQNVCWLCY